MIMQGERGGDSSRSSCASPGESSVRDGRHPRCGAHKGRSADDEGKIGGGGAETKRGQGRARLAEQLRSAETEKTAAKAETKRLRTQNEQWRKIEILYLFCVSVEKYFFAVMSKYFFFFSHFLSLQ